MVGRERGKFTPIEAIFHEPGTQAMVRTFRDRVSRIDGVRGLMVGSIRGESGRKLYVLVSDDANVDGDVTDAVNEAFPDRIAKRQLPCEMVTADGLSETKDEFHGGRKMVFETIWKI